MSTVVDISVLGVKMTTCNVCFCDSASPSPEPSEENKIEIPRASGETATESSPQNDFSDNDICDSAASSEDDEDNKQLNLTDDDCEQSEIKAS